MKRKVRNISIVLSLLVAVLVQMFASVIPVSAQTLETRSVDLTVDSPEEYDNCELNWGKGKLYNQLLSIERNGEITYYQYDEEGKRIGKSKEDETISFEYDIEGNLMSETGNKYTISFQYDDSGVLQQMIYNGTVYKYLLDEDGNVSQILDEQNNVVAKYQYQNSEATVYSMDTDGEWIINQDEDFIGNINKIRFKGYYYDVETSWYYCGRYYDAEQERFVDGINITLTENNPFLNSVARSEELEMAVNNWVNSLLTSSTYGRAISYSSTWYKNLTTVEILARLIYGENTKLLDDQCAVTWVVYNRVATSYNGQNGVREVITADRQFDPIIGNNSAKTKWAREPNTTDDGWINATILACCLCTTTNETDLLGLMNRPPYITNQLYFLGNEYFYSVANYENNFIKINGRRINQVTVVTEGTSNTARFYTTVTSLKNAYPIGTVTRRNVFFNYIDN